MAKLSRWLLSGDEPRPAGSVLLGFHLLAVPAGLPKTFGLYTCGRPAIARPFFHGMIAVDHRPLGQVA
jgi:hypothetical protein